MVVSGRVARGRLEVKVKLDGSSLPKVREYSHEAPAELIEAAKLALPNLRVAADYSAARVAGHAVSDGEDYGTREGARSAGLRVVRVLAALQPGAVFKVAVGRRNGQLEGAYGFAIYRVNPPANKS